MKKIILALMLTTLTACASVQDTYAPDGRKAYALNCSGLARGWDKCQQAAGQICGAKGYDILDRISEDMQTIGAGTTDAFGAKSAERSMLIACKK